MTTEYLIGLGTLCTALGGVIGALLNMLFTKGVDAKVKIIKAESEAKRDEKLAELKSEKECTDELKREIEVLKLKNDKCEEQHIECEKNLAGLKGYMEGKFDLLEKKVTAIETTQVAPVAPVSVQVVEPQKLS